jgi:hypothetical protein
MYDSTKIVKPISYRQKRAVECWLKNGRRSKAAALREAGYSRAVIRQPHKVFSSPVVQEELDRRGFGRAGCDNNLNPHAKPIPVFRETVDFSILTKDQLQELKEKLGDISYKPTANGVNQYGSC